MVFPLPDSPTRPSVSPRSISRSTPASACTGWPREVKVFDRFLMVTTGCAAVAGEGSCTSAGVLLGQIGVASCR